MTAPEDVLTLERELQTPACRRDRHRLNQLIAEDFTEVGASGAVWDRASIIDLLLSDAMTDDIEVHGLTGRLVGEGFALTLWDSRSAGATARRTSLWRQSRDGWQLVHHQGTPLR